MLGNDDKLRRKIRLGEDAILELKDVAFKGTRIAGPDRRGLADELAAFANSRGGLLVPGALANSLTVDESRELSGREPVYRLIDEAELQLTIWSAELPHR